MNDDGLTFPVSKSLAPWFSCCLADIPEPQRSGIERAFFARGVSVRRNEFTGQEERAFFDCWDAMDATGRAAWAARYDLENDPDVSPDVRREMQAAFEGVWRLADLQAEREWLQTRRPEQPSELRIQREELARVDEEIRALAGTSAMTSTAPAKVEMAPAKQDRPQRSGDGKSADRSHRTKGRTHLLDSIIEQAQEACVLANANMDRFNPAAVWVHIESFASQVPPSPPLVGLTSGGVQYRDGGQIETFTKKALADRFRRAKAR